jgi:ABC-2 type transport system permease protein
MSVPLHVFSIEIKKALSYRVTFWVQFILSTGAELAIAYFLWGAIFETTGQTTLQGYSFHGIVYYYLFVSFAVKIGRGNEHGYLAQDIYDGGLTRYLIYPIHFFSFKYVTHLTQQFLAVLQLLLAFVVLRLFLGIPEDSHISLLSVLAGIGTSILMGYLFFVMISCLELVAFWQDIIWNLVAMMRFTMALLGGAMIPLAFFPEWGLSIIKYTPFPIMISFPAQTFLGEIGLVDWFQNIFIMVVWAFFFSCIMALIWRRGIKQYSGVGI